MIERIKIDAAHRDAGRIDGQQFAPHFFFGTVEAYDDDGVRVHVICIVSLFAAYRKQLDCG
jgi:hypothetical protein